MTQSTRQQPAMRLAGARHVGPCNEVGAAFGRLQHILAEGNFWGRSGAWYGLYPAEITDPSDPSNISFAACEFSGDLVDGLEWVDVPAADVAVYTHAGPYEGLPGAWMAAFSALQAGGLNPTQGWSVERYLNDPSDTAPADLRTEILIPVV